MSLVTDERPARIAAPGALQGEITIADDFDTALPEFAAYLDDQG